MKKADKGETGKETVLRKTASVCPECLKILSAEVFERGGKVYIRKACEEHGRIEDIYWGDYGMYKRAGGFAEDGIALENPNITKDKPVCPKDCGICRMHKSHTCLANLVATNRCDLACWYCFFYSGRVGYVYEPGLEQIEEMVKTLAGQRPVRNNAIQITGGEPCLREDLAEIIKICKKHGIEHVQLNTNGIRMSQDLGLCRKISEAGVHTLYLSFDGVSAKSNPKNHWEIPGVMENCRKTGIGIVLVPTVIKGVNDHELGDMIRFGFKNIDVVRSVNFQPVSLVGRITRAERERCRITIPDLIEKLEEQTNREIGRDDFYPVPTALKFSKLVTAFTGKPEYSLSSHFACGMGTYVFDVGGKLTPITRFIDIDGLLEYFDRISGELGNGKNKYAEGLKLLLRLNSFVDKKKAPKGISLKSVLWGMIRKHDYKSLGMFHHKALFIGMMHFMDLYNYDIERVKRCTIHYTLSDGRVVPFCAFNVIPQWYRDVNQKSQGMSFAEWEKNGRRMADDLYRRDVKQLEGTEIYRKVYC